MFKKLGGAWPPYPPSDAHGCVVYWPIFDMPAILNWRNIIKSYSSRLWLAQRLLSKRELFICWISEMSSRSWKIIGTGSTPYPVQLSFAQTIGGGSWNSASRLFRSLLSVAT